MFTCVRSFKDRIRVHVFRVKIMIGKQRQFLSSKNFNELSTLSYHTKTHYLNIIVATATQTKTRLGGYSDQGAGQELKQHYRKILRVL